MESYCNPEYQCCCGNMYVKTGTLVIAVLSFVTGLFSIIYTFSRFPRRARAPSSLLSTSSRPSSRCSLVFHGLKTGKANMLMPFMVYQIFNILQIIGLFLISFIGIFYAQWIIDNSSPISTSTWTPRTRNTKWPSSASP
ncbi:hypothetical protein L596_016461 [Steinernema carpocapsae]|uniref:Uncharacterized protein n=1 Tax=Steinernema carpocapsae TaxID=34508 RepID=A0A4U5NIY7_STECR|nr:hypothetical protein L596_016461 [Steinernema carpocapsae]